MIYEVYYNKFWASPNGNIAELFKHAKEDDYFVFILVSRDEYGSGSQYDKFIDHMKREKVDHLIKYETPYSISNPNYPLHGRKLKIVIMSKGEVNANTR